MPYSILLISLLFLFFACQTEEKKIELAILTQLKQYPESRLQDVYKNFHQNRFGTGHAISDSTMVYQFMVEEMGNMERSECLPVEMSGAQHQYARINLNLVVDGKITAKQLSEAFIRGSRKIDPSELPEWQKEWENIVKVIEKKKIQIQDFEQDKVTIAELLAKEPGRAMHHSVAFRDNYKPHYRVVRSDDVIFKEL